MQVKLIRHFTGKMITTKEGKEFEGSYYYLLTENGKKILVEGSTDSSKQLLSTFADVER